MATKLDEWENREMDIYEKRRSNLLKLLNHHFDGYGRIGALAKRMNWNPSRASAVTREKNPKNIGNQAARLVEQEFGMPRNWLDENTSEDIEVAEDSKQQPVRTRQSGSQTIPLLKTEAEIIEWRENKSIANKETIQFPIFPIMDLSASAYVIEQSTNAMPPMKPGDFYYVDPDREPKTGEKAVFPIEGMLVVGIFEKGLRTSRLLFDNEQEQPENVNASECLGVVMMSMMSDFLKSFPSN